MAERKAAEDEFNPRHRIVGAVILVALAVIFVPMLLSDRPPSTSAPGTGAMPTPETRVVVTPVPLPGDKPEPAKPAADKPAAQRTVTVPVDAAPVKPVTEPDKPKTARTVADIVDETPAPRPPADKKPSATKTPIEPKPAKPASSDPGKWVVQVGVFSHLDNATRLRDQLRHKGYSVTLDPPVPEEGKNVRVEVGPYKDQAAAKAAAARIQGDVGIKGVVRSD